MIFTIDEKDEPIAYMVQLSDATTEKAYNGLVEIMRHVNRAVDRLSPSALENPLGVYSAVAYALDNYSDAVMVNKLVRVAQIFASVYRKIV
jgi:hypothetical protein